MEMTEERVSELEGRATGIIKFEEQKVEIFLIEQKELQGPKDQSIYLKNVTQV